MGELKDLIVCTVNKNGEVNNTGDFVNVPLGAAFLLDGILFTAIYIPCLMAMFHKDLISNACYKILAVMGIVDIFALALVATFSGIASIVGIPYCGRYHDAIKIIGAAGEFVWIEYSGLCMLLSFNRAVQMHSKVHSDKLFGDKKVYIWLAFAFGYGSTCGIIYLTSYAGLLYHSGVGVWLFDPYSGTQSLSIKMNTFNNFATIGIMAVMYACVLCKLRQAVGSISEESRANYNMGKREWRVTLQAFFLCLNTFCSALGYVLVPRLFTTATPFVLVTVLWQFTHGGNVIVYLCLNKTIRKRVLKMLRIGSDPSFTQTPPSTLRMQVLKVGNKTPHESYVISGDNGVNV